MKYIKLLENYHNDFDIDIGDIVVCINVEYSSILSLRLYDKYKVIDIRGNTININHFKSGSNIGFLYTDRFVKLEDFDDWKIQNDANKYNI